MLLRTVKWQGVVNAAVNSQVEANASNLVTSSTAVILSCGIRSFVSCSSEIIKLVISADLQDSCQNYILIALTSATTSFFIVTA